LWRNKFAADRGIVGRAIRLGATSFTVTGVLSRKNAFPVWADVWIPLSRIDPATYSTRKYHPLEVIGRLRPGAGIRQAEVETEKVARQLSADYPATNGKIGAFIVPLMETVTGEVQAPLMAAWAAVALVLLIACANLAHLMMGRALNRRREIAVRLALGAGRFAAFRTFLLETAILSLAGGLLGIFVAYLALPLIEHLAQGQMPRLDNVGLNLPVLLFGLVAALAVAVLFALPSYCQVFRTGLTETISSGNVRTSARQSWLSAFLMSSEVGLSLAVLLAAILLVRSFALTLQSDPGFQSANVLAVDAPLVENDGQKSAELFHNRIAPELRSIPGVQEIAAVNSVPMSLGATEHSRFATRFGIVGRQFEPGRFPAAQTRWSTANYFHLLGIPLRRGRLLTEEDYNQSRCLINEAFARRFFPGSNPVGQQLLLGVVSPHPVSSEIVGVVGDVREFGLSSAPLPAMYSISISPEMQILVKTTTTVPAVRATIAATLHRTNPAEATGSLMALSDYVAASLARQRFILALIATFAGLAICLCGIGIYGVFTYSVTRRLREFGIRTAVGARKHNLVGQVMTECFRVILPGLLVGIAISAATARFMRALLYRVSPMDMFSSGLSVLIIVILCLASVAIPAWRAAKVEPVNILREQ
jgi:predicted permease